MMFKKKDPYIALLDLYYDKFPDSITLKEVYEYFNKLGYISDDELEIIKAFGKTRFEKKDEKTEARASYKRHVYELMFMRAGQSLNPTAYRNAPHVLNSEHYFHRLEYLELKEAGKASRFAFWTSLIAIFISLASLFFAWQSSNKPVKISDNQVQKLIEAIEGIEIND